MRRLLVLYLSAILLAFAVPQSRAILFQQAESPTVQAFLDASVGRGQLATRAIIAQVRQQSVTFIGGQPVVTFTSSNGTRTVTELDASDNWKLDHGCSLTADEVEAVLKAYNSPAAGGEVAQASVTYCKEYGIDNAYWLAMFIRESTAGTAGAAVETANTGNVICVEGYACKGRFADMQGDWARGTELHMRLLKCYRDGGGSGCDGLWQGKKHDTIVDAIATWAPTEDNNDPASYASAVRKDVSNWRAAHTTIATTSGSDLRAKVIELALSRRGDPYVSGARGAGGSDCSGFVQYVYKTATGINPGSTTYDQFPNLEPVEQADLQPGDLWYGRWAGVAPPNNEHTGIVADVDGDGKWDLIHNGADKSQVHVTGDFLSGYLGKHTMGYRTVLGDK
jgi:hypothetical protein